MALTAAILGGVSFVAFALSWIGMTLADRDLPGGRWLEAPAGLTVMYVGLPLLVIGLVGMVLGIAAIVSSFRKSAAGRGRSLALVGVICGLGTAGLIWPINWVGHRLVKRAIDGANVSAFGTAVRIYADHHQGQFPTDLDAILAANIVQPSQICCPNHVEDETRTCYHFIPGQSTSSDTGNVLVYGQVDCVSDHGAHVLFVDQRVEWVAPYSRVVELVEQTKQRLAARAAAPASSGATQQAEGDY